MVCKGYIRKEDATNDDGFTFVKVIIAAGGRNFCTKAWSSATAVAFDYF
jgi:hypothetical protein